MRKCLKIILACTLALSLASCMVTRVVDYNLTGMFQKAKYPNRKVSGAALFLLSVPVDVITFPVQLVLILIFGDDFGFEPKDESRQDGIGNESLAANSLQMAQLSPEQRAALMQTLADQSKDGPTQPHAMGMTPDGRWVAVLLDAESKAKIEKYLQAKAQSGRYFAATPVSPDAS